MKTAVVFPQALWEEMVERFSETSLETAAYALIGQNETAERKDLLVREVIHLEEDDYAERLKVHLLIEPRFIRSIIRRCESSGLGVLAIHSHPMQHHDVEFSASDDFGEERELRVFNDFGAGRWPLASMVWAPGGTRARTWSFQNGHGRATPVDELVIVGRRWHRESMVDTDGDGLADEVHERQIRLFGAEGQRRLASMRVAVVGAGGTGSCVAEMLARLGVGHITLVDHDTLEASNVSRVYGSTPADVGRPKVDVVGAWLERVAPDVRVERLRGDARAHLRDLRPSNFLFVCTDNDASRAALNQFAHQYLKPVIELGNRIESDGRVITAAAARLTYIFPGGPCLECFGSIDHARIREELMPAAERQRLREEGYVRGAEVAEPSVITLNTLIASLACTKFLSIVNGIGGTESQRYTYTYLDSNLRAVGASLREPCICVHYRGYGDLRPLPDLLPKQEG